MDMTKTATCIIRINLNGSIPADNNTPKQDKGCFAWGIRNGEKDKNCKKKKFVVVF